MKTATLFAAGTILVAVASFLAAQDRSGPVPQGKPGSKDQEAIRRIQNILTETVIDTSKFPEKMPLTKFLATLEKSLPPGSKVSFGIDEKAFGKNLRRVSDTTVQGFLPQQARATIVLRKFLAHIPETKPLDYVIRPSGVFVTIPRRAAYRLDYEVGDLVKQVPLLLPQWKRNRPNLYRNYPLDGLELLARLVNDSISLQPWESIEILNGVRLVVTASYSGQEEVASLLAALRRLQDTFVVMNARIYEVDRAFYKKNVAPLFAHEENAEGPGVVTIDGGLFKKIAGHKLIQKGELARLLPNEKASYLSRQKILRYADDKGIHTGITGVSFAVVPQLSPDRRFLALSITQQATRLVGIDRTNVLDPATGKDMMIKSANIHKTTRTGSVRIPDGNPILMPLVFVPEAGSEEKVWLLLARPFIWIKEEMQERKDKGAGWPQKIWDSDPTKEDDEPVTKAVPVPYTGETKEILQALVHDVLTRPGLKDSRAFYGTARVATFTLVDGARAGWPCAFNPKVPGFRRLFKMHRDPFKDSRRVLGIRLDKFNPKERATIFDGPIHVCLFNAGGSANGGVIGGCTVTYEPKRKGKHWTVKMISAVDP